MRTNVAIITDFLFPPRCANCGMFVQQHGGICSTCWQKLTFITNPYCKKCGYPFAYECHEDSICAACMQSPPLYDSHRSALRYDEGIKKLIHMLKYYDQPTALPLMAKWMAQAAADFLLKKNIILMPVPLHRWRMIKRQYNQAALLAKAIAKYSDGFYLLNGLIRTKNNPPQASLDRKHRLGNMHKILTINTRYTQLIRNRPVLIIDDVMTTGATINACAKALRKAGAAEIYSVTLARTILD